jgi:hypothetical protein
MKVAIAVLLLAFAGVYSYAAMTLNAHTANRFLDELETLSLQQKNTGYCARMHSDLEVKIHDATHDPATQFTGDRGLFCDYVAYSAKSVSILGLTTRATRRDFRFERDWWNPWTARVSYREDRITTMSKLDTTLHTQGEDKLTLVQSWRGLRLRKLDSRSWNAE